MPDNNYHAYLLRLWRDNDHAPWRASLRDTRAGQLISFSSMSELVAFLEQQIVTDDRSGRSQQPAR